MLKLRTIEKSDLATIQNWPPYPPEFAELDYALRNNGWLAEFRDQPDTSIYTIEQDGEIVAFTILAKTAQSEAEFRIALRADKIGLGLGQATTSMTLEEGFSKSGLTRIHLIVRINNPRAISLYKRLGFREYGTCVKLIDAKPVDFLQMDISGSPNTKW